jgi:3D (Asp-Asp-Asp) domain-containing protein
MTIIHGFTSFNTIAPASRIAPSSTVTPGADKGVRAAAADWSRWPAGTVFRLLSTEQNYRVEDYGGALSGRNTIDLYMANQREMNSSCAREETIEILQWAIRRRAYNSCGGTRITSTLNGWCSSWKAGIKKLLLCGNWRYR